jgi:hypothetical protein
MNIVERGIEEVPDRQGIFHAAVDKYLGKYRRYFDRTGQMIQKFRVGFAYKPVTMHY